MLKNAQLAPIRLGVDLGGTKIEVIALNAQGEPLIRERRATPQGDYAATVATVAQLVFGVEHRLQQRCSVGVATPGALSPATGRIKNSNSVCLIDQPLDQDLSFALQRPVRLNNDANCFALSEAIDGAASGAAVVFGVIIGTGTGGGIVVHQQVLTGINGIGGEWGHNPLPWPQPVELPGPQCYCGQQGCLETFLSGPGLAYDYYQATGEQRTALEIEQLAQSGQKAAHACLQRYMDRLARGLASIINVLDPEIIVLGGGLSNMSLLYQQVPLLWQNYVFSDRVDTQLKPAQYGDSSGVRGAAWLWSLSEAATLF